MTHGKRHCDYWHSTLTKLTWWSMRWPSDAVSLLGRACDLNTGKTYELLRQLREFSVTHLRQLWSVTTDRRQRSDDSGARQHPGRVERNEAQVRADWPQLQTEADAGMDHCGRAAAVKTQTAACWMEACPLNCGTACWPTNYWRIRNEARADGERSWRPGRWRRGGACGQA